MRAAATRARARRTIRDANRASDVITRLRALFARKSGNTAPVDLNDAARDVLAMLRSQLRSHRVIARAELCDDLPPVVGDRVQLEQVILNLLLNAQQAMIGINDRPKELVIRTERDDGDHVRLTVKDAGTGFIFDSARVRGDAGTCGFGFAEYQVKTSGRWRSGLRPARSDSNWCLSRAALHQD